MPCLVFGGTGHSDQGGIDDCALPNRHASLTQVSLDHLKNRHTQVLLLQQVSEAENRDLIRDLVTDQINSCEPPHGGHLNQGLFHRWITQRIPLLQQLDAEHGGQWIGRSSSLLAGFGVVGFDQRYQGLPWDYRLHSGEELLLFGLLLAVQCS